MANNYKTKEKKELFQMQMHYIHKAISKRVSYMQWCDRVTINDHVILVITWDLNQFKPKAKYSLHNEVIRSNEI